MAPHELSVVELATHIASGELSAVEAAQAYLGRIEALDGALNAFLHVDREGALAQAAAIDEARSKGEPLGLLAGVPLGLKDNMCTRGLPTTCASRILEGYAPPYDGTVVARLRDAGAVIVGKLNMDEFAMGSSTESSAFGPTRNPYALDRSPGGSSGGSASATAASLVAAALGSDTGGSVRQPGAFCGVTAMKPTYGKVSRYGLVAFASSLDQIGPLTRNARDAARLLDVIAGYDAADATSVQREHEACEPQCGRDLRGLRVGVLRDVDAHVSDPAVREAVDRAYARLQALGCALVDVALPHAEYGLATYYVLVCAEASSNLARFDGMRYGLRVDGSDLRDTYGRTRDAGFGAEVKRRIMLGTYALSAGYYDAYYLKAQKVRTRICQDYARAFEKCDVVAGPTTPTTAFPIGAIVEPLAMYAQDIFTLPAPLAGLPALSTPCGLSPDGLPIGLHLVAPAFEDARLLRVAAAFETDQDQAFAPAEPLRQEAGK